MNDLVFEAGESRDRIVKWLVEEVLDGAVDKVDYGHHTSGSKHTDTKSQTGKLALICSCLGLCEATDVELVSGALKTPAQILFINRLLSMVETLGEGKCVDLVAQGKELVADMTQEELREATCRGDIDLIPADIKKYIELDSLAEGEGTEGKQGVKIVSLLAELVREAANIESEISTQTKDIESLAISSEQAGELADLMHSNRMECITRIKSISASIQNLKFLLANFTDFYRIEVEPELTRRHFAPLQTELGLQIAQAHSALRDNLELIERAKDISLSAKHIRLLNASKHEFGQLGKLAAELCNADS